MNQNNQTFTSFKDKWEKNSQLAFSETMREGSDIFQWILTRNGFRDSNELKDFLGKKIRVLDAGCGNGRVTAMLQNYAPSEAFFVAIDLTAAHIARENLKNLSQVEVFEKDLLGDLTDLGEFDFIYCQEVLHHTANPKLAFLNLCGRLSPKGEIAIYVYKLKAPIREYSDDYIRDKISGLSYEKASELMEEITKLGEVLSDLKTRVSIPKVELLGIEAGEYDLQRFLYHFFLKCFWNPDLDWSENVAINYDWYHPQLCTRHTPDEILGWFADAQLKVNNICVDHYGITVRGMRQS